MTLKTSLYLQNSLLRQMWLHLHKIAKWWKSWKDASILQLDDVSQREEVVKKFYRRPGNKMINPLSSILVAWEINKALMSTNQMMGHAQIWRMLEQVKPWSWDWSECLWKKIRWPHQNDKAFHANTKIVVLKIKRTPREYQLEKLSQDIHNHQ